jgi:feruloyl-CoA synthase
MDQAQASRLRFAAPQVEVRRDGDVIRLTSPMPLQPHATRVSAWLQQWAIDAPERVFLAERLAGGGGWRELRYGQALNEVRCIAQGLLRLNGSANRTVMILSENSIDHGLLTLAAMHVGQPVVPVSTAYSLIDPSFSKLRHIAQLIQPGIVFVSDAQKYGPALEAIGLKATSMAELTAEPAGHEVDVAHAATTPESVAKVLFTSGSTGVPKGVINTQRMLTANQQQSLQVWPFLADQPPVVVDWLPWNHTFGGNYSFNLVLSNGGTLYIDGGKPAPGLFEESIRNLREIAPTLYFNVPKGFDLLIPLLEEDDALRAHFFSKCSFAFYAAASLPANQWDRFLALAARERGGDIALVSSWGSTETAPLCTAVHFPVQGPGIIGLPVSGLELKLVPNGDKYEARVRGPNITPGYFAEPHLTQAAFDEEGYYLMGDAVRFADPAQPEKGVVFDGRVAEDFKLTSGTWVNVGKLRVHLLSVAEGLIQDAVITGHGRDEVGALLFLNPTLRQGLSSDVLASRIATALERQNQQAGSGSSTRIARAIVLHTVPRMDLGEITDKGYINQRLTLETRKSAVDRLYAEAADPDVIHMDHPHEVAQ